MNKEQVLKLQTDYRNLLGYLIKEMPHLASNIDILQIINFTDKMAKFNPEAEVYRGYLTNAAIIYLKTISVLRGDTLPASIQPHEVEEYFKSVNPISLEDTLDQRRNAQAISSFFRSAFDLLLGTLDLSAFDDETAVEKPHLNLDS